MRSFYVINEISVKIYFCLFLVLSSYTSAFAQVVDTEANKEAPAEPAWAPDSLGRRTPRGTVSGFIKAVASENYARAGQYLRLEKIIKKKQNREDLARSLQQLLDKNGSILPYSLISDSHEGVLDDNLGPDLERVGTAKLNNEEFDLILERTVGSEGEPVWLFSSETVQRLPLLVAEAPIAPLIDRLAPASLEGKKWAGVPVTHWVGVILLLIISYLVAWSITALLQLAIPLFWRKARIEPTSGIIAAFALPIRLYITVWLFKLVTEQAGISIVLRQRFSSLAVIVAIVAMLLLLWQLLDVSTRFFERRLTHRHNQAGVSAILFLRRAAKVALFFLAAIFILDTFGVDVTTGLAALGIGGIALALGAQKTMENFVGSVTLIIDQPVRVGDFCRVGDTYGTIEQIGMRSTRIRTNDRTVITIPNGDFASQKIENFAHRDRFLLNPVLRLRLDTSPDQVRYLLVELRSILYAHPKVDSNPARLRFLGVGTDALRLEIFAYVNAVDFDQFLEVQEDLYLRMMDVIKACGTSFALPSQSLYLNREEGISEEKAADAGKRVKEWTEANELQIPRFEPDRIESLKNSIPFPPEGSVQRKVK